MIEPIRDVEIAVSVKANVFRRIEAGFAARSILTAAIPRGSRNDFKIVSLRKCFLSQAESENDRETKKQWSEFPHWVPSFRHQCR